MTDQKSGHYIYLNAAATTLLGNGALHGTDRNLDKIGDGERFAILDSLSAGKTSAEFPNVKVIDSGGQPSAFNVHHCSVAAVGYSPCTVTVAEDVTLWFQAEQCLSVAAKRDPLTRLLNRDGFIEALDDAIRTGSPLALLSVDLDGFKRVNDRLGHVAGDTALEEVAKRLAKRTLPENYLARLGGDEFALIVTGDDAGSRAAELAAHILAGLEEPLASELNGIVVGASIGIALAPEHAVETQTLRRCADLALYRAKSTGGRRSCMFGPGFEKGSAWPTTNWSERIGMGLDDAPARSIVAANSGERRNCVVCIVEIDRFAALRHRIGFDIANSLVDQLAERIERHLSDSYIGRAGRTSIEFVFPTHPDHDPAEELGALVAELERPMRVNGCEFDLTVTIGAAGATKQAIDERKLDAAAAALAMAQDRHEKVVLANPREQHQLGVEQLSIMRDLRRAMTGEELTLHYQPKLRCRTETIESAEALLRWHHPEHGLVRTDRLIDIAEATGAIRELTFWAIDKALADHKRLAAGGRAVTIDVNISGQLLGDRGFAQWALDKLEGAPGAIGFEITETAVIKDPVAAIEHLHKFAAAGIRIAIDDYGSGLSSLAYLKQLPAHELKIDRMFVSGLTESHRDPLLVRSSIDLAHALEMEVTAEGVDDPISLSLLRVMGCDMVQGYLVSPALPIESFEAFLQEDRFRAQPDTRTPTLHGWNVTTSA